MVTKIEFKLISNFSSFLKEKICIMKTANVKTSQNDNLIEEFTLGIFSSVAMNIQLLYTEY